VGGVIGGLKTVGKQLGENASRKLRDWDKN
jgi:hypothetical protein